MVKLGVITDGISRDFERALQVMTEAGLMHAELQFLWDKEVGDLTPQEMDKAQDLIKRYQVTVSCISRHNFSGMLVGAVEPEDAVYTQHMDGFKRCIEMAHRFGTRLVRIMSFRREMILFGRGGAEHWVVSKGSWDKFKTLLEAPVRLAEVEGITLVLETGNNAMITSGYLGGKLVEEMGSDHLKILWDPCNSLYANENTYPDGYEALGIAHLGHIHLKDARVDMPKATVEFCEFGSGDMAGYFEPLSRRLKADEYDGVISLESVYRPRNGTFEDGFRASVSSFKRLFAD